MEPSEQIALVPLNVPAFGAAVTTISLVDNASEQPPVPVTVYVIVDVPPATGLISPVELLMVATLVLPLDHVPPASPSDEKVVEPSEQIALVPLSVPASGTAVIVPDKEVVVAEAKPPPEILKFAVVGLELLEAILT